MPINTSNFLILNKRKIIIQGPDFFSQLSLKFPGKRQSPWHSYKTKALPGVDLSGLQPTERESSK